VDRVLDIVVMKEYPTAVGLKQAATYFSEDSVNAQFGLKGYYVSEGSNALAGCFACIKADADLSKVEALVDAFAAEANQRVSETYAASLLKA
jgi:hypothetical protein